MRIRALATILTIPGAALAPLLCAPPATGAAGARSLPVVLLMQIPSVSSVSPASPVSPASSVPYGSPGLPGSSPSPEPLVSPVRIDSFSADPSQVQRGGMAILSWATTGAAGGTIRPGVGAVPASGSTSVAPASTTEYTLSVVGQGGPITSTATVKVVALPPRITAFVAAPPSVPARGTSRLSWTTENATAATLDGGIGSVGLNSRIDVRPADPTTYTLSVEGYADPPATAQVTVRIEGRPAITAFGAEPQEVEPGQSATLSWASTDATEVSIDGGVGPGPAIGSAAVTPPETTTYALTVTGPGGRATAKTTVSVVPRGLSFSAPELSLSHGASAAVKLRLNPARAEATTVALKTSDAAVAKVPEIVTIPAGSRAATLTVSASGSGSARVTANVPDESASEAALRVSVACKAPPPPQAKGPNSGARPGSDFSVTWGDVFGGGDAAGVYEAALALDPGFTRVIKTERTQGREAAFSVPAKAAEAVYVRVRAIAGCGVAGDTSTAVKVKVRKGGGKASGR